MSNQNHKYNVCDKHNVGDVDILYEILHRYVMDTDQIYEVIGERIRTRRKTLGLTQEKLAPRLGMSRASLANIETGRQTVLVHQLYRLAEALEMSPTDFLPIPEGNPRLEQGSDLPLPEDLKPLQRNQIARLFK